MCVNPDRAAILDRLVGSAQCRKSTVSAFRALEAPTAEQATAFARVYTGEKFLTPQPPADSDSIYDLGQASYRRLQQLKTAGCLGDEFNTGCSGASSAMSRKALFFMSLQRDLGVNMDAGEIESAETVGDIAALCVKYCCKE